LLAHHTGQPLDRIKTDTERDYFMTSDEALTYGIVDAVVTKRVALPPHVEGLTAGGKAAVGAR